MSEFQICGFQAHLYNTLRRFYLISCMVFKENLLIFLSRPIIKPAAAGRMTGKRRSYRITRLGLAVAGLRRSVRMKPTSGIGERARDACWFRSPRRNALPLTPLRTRRSQRVAKLFRQNEQNSQNG